MSDDAPVSLGRARALAAPPFASVRIVLYRDPVDGQMHSTQAWEVVEGEPPVRMWEGMRKALVVACRIAARAHDKYARVNR